MRFNSYEFILFFAVVLAIAPRLQLRARHIFLLAASYFFYATWNPPFVLLLFFTTALDYVCGGRVARARTLTAKRAWFFGSVACNLGILFYFKYGNFFFENIAFVSGIDPEPFYLDVVIPLGISFYTFQSMSYVIDMYRGAAKPCDDFIEFALFVTFFAHMIAGPILRSVEFLPQLRRTAPVTQTEVLRGIELFLLGLFKKTVVADNLAVLADEVFGSPGSYSGAGVLLASFAFWIQIYCDFSGYSTMAQGIASLLGFSFPKNFDYPQLRHNPILYRRSWHITMGNWFTDYVYRPLGGSRVGDLRFGFNVFITWTLLGLWHGAAWNFVLWGAYNGLILAVYSVVMRRKRWALPAFRGKLFLGWVINVAMLVFSAMLFRSANASSAWLMVQQVFSWGPGQGVAPGWLAFMLALASVHAVCFWYYQEDLLERLGWPGRIVLVSAVVTAIAIFGATSRPFIYFQF